MMKKLLTAFFAVAALVVVVPSAEARWGKRSCGKSCAPKRCEEKPRCEAPKCTVEVVDTKLYPCCKTESYVVNGYKECPVEEKCCKTVRCCPERMSCCYFPGQDGFDESKANAAHNGGKAEMVTNAESSRPGLLGGRARREARREARDEASDIVE